MNTTFFLATKRIACSVLIFLLFTCLNTTAAPLVSYFEPVSGSVGSTVVITGLNFSVTASNNVVRFGGIKATIIDAQSDKLTVLVPAGVVYDKISVTVDGFSSFSKIAFSCINKNICGKFDPNSSISATGLGTSATISGDFNQDGKIDLVIANSAGNTISILPGDGTGSFPTKTNLTLQNPLALISSDFNNDGFLDIVASSGTDSELHIFPGNGDGTFKTATTTQPVGNVLAIASGDFNLDNVPDLICADNNSTQVYVLLGNGDATFNAPVSYTGGNNPYGIAVADFDNNDRPDFAVTGSDNVKIFFGQGDGTFIISGESPLNLGSSAPRGIVAEDFNKDGKVDIATANNSSTNLSVFYGSGTGSFEPRLDYAAPSNPNSYGIKAGDFNADGKIDLILTADQNLYLFFNDGVTFSKSLYVTTTTYSKTISINDFNGDGVADIATDGGTSYMAKVVLGSQNPNVTLVSDIYNKCNDNKKIKLTASGALSNTFSWGSTTSTTPDGVDTVLVVIDKTTLFTLIGKDAQGCADTTTTTVNITNLNGVAIEGSSFALQGSSYTYDITDFPATGSTVWSYSSPADVTITEKSSMQAEIAFGPNATDGTITAVYTRNGCSKTITLPVTVGVVITQLAKPGKFIQYSSPVCTKQTGVKYSIPKVKNATYYDWTCKLPGGGAIITSNNNTDTTVSFNFPEFYNTTTLTISVVAKYVKTGQTTIYSASLDTTIIINPAASQPSITGPSRVCMGVPNTYTISNPIAGETYSWSIEDYPQGSGSVIDITFNNKEFPYVTAYALNACGYSPPSPNHYVELKTKPQQPLITGPLIQYITIGLKKNSIYSGTGNDTIGWKTDGLAYTMDNYKSVNVTFDEKSKAQQTIKAAAYNFCGASDTTSIIINTAIAKLIIVGNSDVAIGISNLYRAIPVDTSLRYRWKYTPNNPAGKVFMSNVTGDFTQLLFQKNLIDTSGILELQAWTLSGSDTIKLQQQLKLKVNQVSVSTLPFITIDCRNEFDCENSYISTFSLNTLNSTNSICSGIGYADYTQSVMTTTLLLGDKYTFSIDKNRKNDTTLTNQYYGVWLDYNNDGSFETDEVLGVSFAAAPSYEDHFVVRNSDEVTGQRRLRIRSSLVGPFKPEDGCQPANTTRNGETEDYLITLQKPTTTEATDLITPNDDGFNDVFFIKGIDASKDTYLEIFDRWGKVLFKKSNYENDWRGIDTSGAKLPTGTYFYVFSNGDNVIKGFFELKY